MDGFRQLLKTAAGKGLGIAVSILLIGVAAFAVKSFFKGDTPDFARESMYICAETGKTFNHTNRAGDSLPIESPYTGRKTAWPAESCYWTASGAPKAEPTWVLVQEFTGKPGPTFCPDCGRRVVGHNPSPHTGMTPPPTKEEYAARKSKRPLADGTDER